MSTSVRRLSASAGLRAFVRWGFVLLVAVSAGGCAVGGGSRSAARVESSAEGLEISESAVHGLGARSEFRSATLLIEQGEAERALPRLRALAEAEPDVSAPQVNLAIALQQAGDYAEAENALRRALSVNDRHPVAHNELGIVLRRLGRFEEARQSYERALEIHPGFHFALRNRGIVCELFLRDETCAIESYRAYLEASPGDDEVGLWVALLEARSSTEEGG